MPIRRGSIVSSRVEGFPALSRVCSENVIVVGRTGVVEGADGCEVPLGALLESVVDGVAATHHRRTIAPSVMQKTTLEGECNNRLCTAYSFINISLQPSPRAGVSRIFVILRPPLLLPNMRTGILRQNRHMQCVMAKIEPLHEALSLSTIDLFPCGYLVNRSGAASFAGRQIDRAAPGRNMTSKVRPA
jgi:hypothetical protein